jgi:MATE family multidrug resistance protein
MADLASPSSAPRALVPALLRIAAPVALARLGIMGMGIVDTVLLGQIVPHELPFLALGWAPTAVFLVGGIGLLMGVQVLAARVIGEGFPAQAGAVWRRGMALAGLCGVVCAVLLALTVAPLLQAFGVEAELIEPAAHVARVLAMGMPLHFLFVACSYYLEAIQRPNAASVIIWIANGVNLALCLWFVPLYGAAGCAWATLFSRSFMAIAIVAWIWFSSSAQTHGVRAPAREGPGYGALLSVGVAAALSQVAEAGAFSGMTIIAGRIGADAVAAYQILLQTLAVVFMIALGMSSATAVLVSDAYGRGDGPGVVRAGWTGLWLNAIAMLIAGAGMFAFAHAIARGFTADAALALQIAALIPLIAVIPTPDGGQSVGAAALRARGDNWFPTASHILAYVLVMPPLAFYLGEALGQGVRGLMTSILVASILSVSVLLIRFAALGRRLPSNP